MYLYALDLSLDCTGLVIFDMKTMKPVLITSFQTNPYDTHGARLHALRSGIVKEGKPFLPSEVAVERGFTLHNEATQVLFRVHGVANELFFAYPQYYYVVSTIKLTVAGHGAATKAEVERAILKNYPDLRFRNDNESDAMAIAITHMVKEHKMKWDAPLRIKKETKPKKATTRKKKTSTE